MFLRKIVKNEVQNFVGARYGVLSTNAQKAQAQGTLWV